MKMKVNNIQSESKIGLQESLIIKHNQELSAAASLTSETLSKLNITLESLPPHCQQLVTNIAATQTELSITQLDLPTILYQQSIEKSQKFDQDYDILKLRQKNEELQAKIDRNNTFLQGLRQELLNYKESLKKGTPNMDNIEEYIRQMKQKVVSYEESYENAKSKYSKLEIPDELMPGQVVALAESVAQLREQEAALHAQAEDIRLARHARQTLCMLRR